MILCIDFLSFLRLLHSLGSSFIIDHHNIISWRGQIVKLLVMQHIPRITAITQQT
jgi:hypothetical protein